MRVTGRGLLDAARIRAEQAAEMVAQRAAEFRANQEKVTAMYRRLQALGESAREMINEMSAAKDAANAGKDIQLPAVLAAMSPRLNSLLADSKQLRDDARAANMKTLAKSAEDLSQNLGTALNRMK